MHGSHTHGRGFKKKGRGSGHRGGVGMSGTGKRADQRKTLILNIKEGYFGGQSLKPKVKKYKVINLNEVERIANGKKEIKLDKYKILSKGEIKEAIIIHAFAASKKAIEKVKKAGGKIVLEDGKFEKSDAVPARG